MGGSEEAEGGGGWRAGQCYAPSFMRRGHGPGTLWPHVSTSRDPLACQLLHCLAALASILLAATLAATLVATLATTLAKLRALPGLEPCPRQKAQTYE